MTKEQTDKTDNTNKTDKTDKYKEFKAKAKDDDGFRSFCIQLYEKGLLSGETLLNILGFDSDEEITRLKNDLTKFPLSNQIRHVKNSESPLTIQLARIEQARRNVEAFSRMLGREGDLGDAVKKSIKLNIEVMDEVTKIK